jgi:NAD(P)-dependent dehydrogenase (short-subunit alcohol dehydrogenase family)
MSLNGRVALVAGATRGAGRGIAIALGEAGATVYCSGRSVRGSLASGPGRPETIDETAEMVTAAGGTGIAVRCDHTADDQVRALLERVRRDQGHLDVLVNDVWGGDALTEWDKKLWEHDLAGGLQMLRMGVHTHLITSAKALPLVLRGESGLVVEVTDGTSEYNKNFRQNVGFYYDLVKANVERITIGLAAELDGTSCTALALTPGWLRSEQMLENFGVTEETWRDALAKVPHFGTSETPTYVGRAVVALAGAPDVSRYAGKVLSTAEVARTYGITDVDGTQPDSWRYLAEIQGPGLPPTELGYR